MTVAQVKTYLGIPTATTTYDTDIARYLPIVESTVNRITGSIYIMQVNGSTTTGSKELLVESVYSQTRLLFGGYTVQQSQLTNYPRDGKGLSGEGFPYGDPGPAQKRLHEIIYPGQLITGTGIPTDAFIESVSTFGGVAKITISAVATVTGSVSAYTSYPISFMGTIAHGIWWMIGQQKMASSDNTWIQRSVGPVTETRSASEMKLDGMYGMPAWFVKSFPRVYQ